MPITLITGVPGAGKTLSALQMAMKARGEREVFVCGVEGLKQGEFNELDDPREWQDCPDGSLIVVDEAWKWFGLDAQRATKLPDDPRIVALAEHRHRGFDFILTGQIPGQFCSYVKGQCGRHIHVVRKFGTTMAQRFEWGAVVASPNNTTERKRGTESAWSYPKEVYSLYRSATLHTVKRKIPLKVLALPVVALLAVVLIVYGVTRFAGVGDNLQQSITGQGANAEGASATEHRAMPVAKGGVGIAGLTRWDTPEQYLLAHLPRIEGIPGSAPIFDDRVPKSEPRMYCVQVGKSCGCYTEQVTPIKVGKKMCMEAARFGVYDPYREPYENREPDRQSFVAQRYEQRERSSTVPRIGRNYVPPADVPAPPLHDGRSMFSEHQRQR